MSLQKSRRGRPRKIKASAFADSPNSATAGKEQTDAELSHLEAAQELLVSGLPADSRLSLSALEFWLPAEPPIDEAWLPTSPLLCLPGVGNLSPFLTAHACVRSDLRWSA